jgi:murein L,D-transpeptidase YcbB/YkuD
MREAANGRTKAFYADRQYTPLWFENGKPGKAASALVALVETATYDNLDPGDYRPQRLRAALIAAETGRPEALAKADVALSRTLADYVRDLRKPKKQAMAYAEALLKPRRPDRTAVLKAAAAAASLPHYIESMGWMTPGYRGLRDALARLAPATAANVHAQDAAQVLKMNLARARVLPGPALRHILVDAGGAQLYLVEDGKIADSMRVIVGKPEEPTPTMAGIVRYAIVNPYWNLPPDLVRKRVVPLAAAGKPIASLGFEALSDWTPEARRLQQSEIDWAAVASGARDLRVRQKPGGSNAMGRVKFMFPNELGIYLHDTPERNLFKKDNRHLSSGCVRVEDAPRLARWLFGKPLSLKARAPEQFVPVPAPVPIYITYMTAVPEKAGVAFRTDIYGKDAGKRLALR